MSFYLEITYKVTMSDIILKIFLYILQGKKKKKKKNPHIVQKVMGFHNISDIGNQAIAVLVYARIRNPKDLNLIDCYA